MRSIALLLGTLVMLLVAFGIYWVIQPTPSDPQTPLRADPRTSATVPAPLASDRVDGTITGPGQDVWLRTYDDRTGRLAWQFRAARYDPDASGTAVSQPQARFFLSDGGMLSIDARHGRVFTGTETTGRTDQMSGITQMPRRGELHDVTLLLFENETSTEPLLSCRVNNIVFDNDTFRIATDAYTDEDGQFVPADQVEVIVVGRDFDFEGRGLTIRWNERDRRLQWLEISHGRSMTIKNPQVLGGFTAHARNTAWPALASAQRFEAAAPSTTPAWPKQPVMYQATFRDAVRIRQQDRTLARSDELRVEFAPDAAQERSDASPRPNRSGGPSRPGRTESSAPLVVEWTGPLRVEPLDEQTLANRDDLEPALELIGRNDPVVVEMDGTRIQAGTVGYQRKDQRLLIRGSQQWPTVRLVDARGASVETSGIDYSQSKQTASLIGKSRAEFPVSDEQRTTVVQASWEDMCILGLTGDARGSLSIESADLSGNVRLEHPQLRLSAHRVELSMGDLPEGGKGHAKASHSLVLRRLTASRDVVCDLVDDASAIQRLEAQKLVVHTEPQNDGSLRPHRLEAEGRVLARDERGELAAGRLVAEMGKESTQGQVVRPVVLKELKASEDVRFEGADGRRIRADQLRISGPDRQHIELVGRPQANITDANGELTGSIIRIDTHSGRASVTGAGRLTLSTGTNPQNPQLPLGVDWSRELSIDSDRNFVEVIGDVQVTSMGTDRSVQQARAQRMTMTLEDSATVAGSSGSHSADMLAGKVIRQITLHEQAQLSSVLSDADGQPLRRIYLQAPRIDYEAETGRLSVSQPGRMLFEDRRPHIRTEKAGDSFRGATAFSWRDSLVYDPSSGQASMRGEVVVVYEPTHDAQERFRLLAEEVIAEVEPRPRSLEQTPVLDLGPKAGDLRLQQVRAWGGVSFSSEGIQFQADRIDYEPAAFTISARGTDRHPVSLLDARGMSTGRFAELYYNTQTEQIRLRDFAGTLR